MRMAAQDSGRNHAEGVNYWLVHLMEIRRNSDHILEVQRTFLSELVKGVLSKYTSLAPPPPSSAYPFKQRRDFINRPHVSENLEKR